MRDFDFDSPLFRTFIGFDQLARELSSAIENGGYPPFNIEAVGDNGYRVELAVAGFKRDEIEVKIEDEKLLISGKKAEGPARTYIHQGIAARSFERRFRLADHVKVTGAELADGLLSVSLEREIPEAKKPRTVDIRGS